MNVEIDGNDFDLEDPGMKAEAIRKWLRSKADTKTFSLSDPADPERRPGETPCRPLPALPAIT
jgi:hypothetical protein